MSSTNTQLYRCLEIPDGDWRDVHDTQAISMAMIHNVFIRGFNSLIYYSQEVQPETKQLESFLAYAQEVCTMLHHHHKSEEALFFPFLEAKMGAGRMSENVAAHEAFSKPFDGFEQLVKNLNADPQQWDANTFRDGIHRFMPVLREHLAEELTTLDAAEMRKYFTPADFAEFDKALLEDIKKNTALSKGPQLALVNGDSVNGDWFPLFPLPLMFLVKYCLYWIHSDLWEFGCCDKNKRVKPQFASYEPRKKA